MGKMKVLVISDSHSNISNLKHVMGFAKKIKAKAVIHCGDWNNPISVDAVTNFNIPLYSVIGNADINPEIRRNLILKSEGFSEDFLKFELDGVKIGITHKPSDIRKYFDVSKLDIIFCGHLHSKDESSITEPKKTPSVSSRDELDSDMSSSFGGNPNRKIGEDVINGVKVIRPGALETTVNFAVYDTKTNTIEFIDNNGKYET